MEHLGGGVAAGQSYPRAVEAAPWIDTSRATTKAGAWIVCAEAVHYWGLTTPGGWMIL